MKFRILTEARQDLDRQMNSYEKKKSGLGLGFSDKVVFAIGEIISNPKAWPPIDLDMRRYIINRFPFEIIYHFDETKQKVIIIAVGHQHQKPGYWKDRWQVE